MVVLSSDRLLNFDTLAQFLGMGGAELASHEELADIVGYPPMGVSPLGVEGIRTILDSKLQQWPTVLIGAGTLGVELELPTTLLAELTKGTWVDLST